MSKAIQLRRGTAAQHTAFTGAVGEVTVSTDDRTLRVHDGVTPGGVIAQAPLVERLKAWGSAQAMQFVTTALNADGVITAASIVWPDGIEGQYYADQIDADTSVTLTWRATYVHPVLGTRTVTQPLMTINPDGAVMNQPPIQIT